MRLIFALGVLVFGAGFDIRDAKAQQPWCAYYDPYTYNCGFYTFEQCLATISAVGGTCQRNPREESRYHHRREVPSSDEMARRRYVPSPPRGNVY